MSAALSSKMVTIFCVQAYWRDKRKLAAGAFRQFKTAEQAIRAGSSLAPQNAGVVVFSVTGSAEADFWNEPVMLAKHGEVPDLLV